MLEYKVPVSPFEIQVIQKACDRKKIPIILRETSHAYLTLAHLNSSNKHRRRIPICNRRVKIKEQSDTLIN